MNPKWAEENLQTIRTLMERSALYRRALAPIMIYVGSVGIVGGIAGWQCSIKSNTGFVWLWICAAVISLIGALLLVRRQALSDSEPFWSPPVRRIGQALLPAFFAGLVLGILMLIGSYHHDSEDGFDDLAKRILLVLWLWFYGFAIHAAGFFMPRGVRWFGWIFILAGFVLLISIFVLRVALIQIPPHLLMGSIFGGLHLAYGIYLYFTEKKTPNA